MTKDELEKIKYNFRNKLNNFADIDTWVTLKEINERRIKMALERKAFIVDTDEIKTLSITDGTVENE